MNKKTILFCLLLFIILISGCTQTSTSDPMHTSPAPAMPSLELNTSPNPAPENSIVTATIKLTDARKLPLANEIVYINLTRTFDRVQIIDNMVHGNKNTTVIPYQLKTDENGEAKLDINIPPVSWHEGVFKVYSTQIEINVFWKNTTSSYSISTQQVLSSYKTGPPAQIESLWLWGGCISRVNENCNLIATLNPAIDLSDFYGQSLDYKGTLNNAGPINLKIIQGKDIASLSTQNLYTNYVGQAFANLIATKSGVVVVQATYQNFTTTANATFIPSQIPLLPPEPYVLTVNANPNPAASGNNVTITAKLTQNGLPLSNQQITFYMVSSTNIVGSTPGLSGAFSHTDSNGEASAVLKALRAGEDKVAAIWEDYSNMVTVKYK